MGKGSGWTYEHTTVLLFGLGILFLFVDGLVGAGFIITGLLVMALNW